MHPAPRLNPVISSVPLLRGEFAELGLYRLDRDFLQQNSTVSPLIRVKM